MGVINSKCYSSYKSPPKGFKLVLKFIPNGLLFVLGIVEYEETKTSIIWKMNDRRVKRSKIWDSRRVVQPHVSGTFALAPFKATLESFGAIFCN